MTYLCVVARYKTTCLRTPGITCVTQEKPRDNCPICFKPLHVKNSCVVIQEMGCDDTLKIWKKEGPNIKGPPEPRAKSLEGARRDAQARARRPNMRL